MRRLIVAVALASAGFGAATARAADVAQLNCPTSVLSPAELADLTQFIADQGASTDPRLEPIRRAGGQCAARLSWSDRQMRLALVHELARIGIAGVRRQFEEMGIDLAPLEPTVINDRPLMDAARAGQLTQEQGTAFALRHIGVIQRLLGNRLEDTALAERLGFFIGYRAMMEAARLQFAEN